MNRDRPSQLTTFYQQILQLDDSVQKLVNKKAETLRDPGISLKRKIETEKYFHNLNSEWLTYIHGETNMSSQQSQSTLHANEEQPPANSLHQIEQNDGVPEFKQKHDNTSHRTLNTVTRNGQSNNQDHENGSETSSAKRRIEENTRDFENEFETKLQLERTQFERTKLELKMQMKELEMQHQLRRKERDLECRLQKTGLEKDDLHSQSTKARDKSPFNWTPNGRDVSEWVNSMNDTRTLIRPRARFDVSPEQNKHRHYPGYSNSRERSASAEERDISPMAGRHYNIGHSSSSLPKLRLNNFGGNPLEWPEWCSMLIATVDKRMIPDSEKMSHLKTLLTGKAKSAITGMGYSGQFYSAAWNILERKFGWPHVVIDAQLESLQKANQVKPHDSTSLIFFLLLYLTSWTCSKSTNILVICNQVRRCTWQLISYQRFLKKNGGSTSMTRTKTGLILSCLKNGYHEWHGGCLEHSWHTWDARFEDREGSHHNKGTTFKGAFNWSVCTRINLVGKQNIWLQGTEEQLQTPEYSRWQNIQPDGSRHYTRTRCLRNSTSIGL